MPGRRWTTSRPGWPTATAAEPERGFAARVRSVHDAVYPRARRRARVRSRRRDGGLGLRRLAGVAPGRGRAHRHPRRGRLGGGRAAGRGRALDRPGPRLHRPGRRGADRPGRGGRPPRLDPGQRRQLRHDPLARGRAAGRQEGPADRGGPGRGVPGHRRRGRRAARLPRRQGARAVRPVLRRRRPAAPRRAQHRARRAGAAGAAARLPAVGLPARGDPPGAVHRRALDARPPARRDGAHRGHPRAHPAPRRRRRGGSARRCAPLVPARQAGAA